MARIRRKVDDRLDRGYVDGLCCDLGVLSIVEESANLKDNRAWGTEVGVKASGMGTNVADATFQFSRL